MQLAASAELTAGVASDDVAAESRPPRNANYWRNDKRSGITYRLYTIHSSQ